MVRPLIFIYSIIHLVYFSTLFLFRVLALKIVILKTNNSGKIIKLDSCLLGADPKNNKRLETD